jgi:hypothetical protein
MRISGLVDSAMDYFKKSEKSLQFIHIPKTGGTYFTQRGKQTLIEGVKNLGHTMIDDCNYGINKLYYPRDMVHAKSMISPFDANKNTRYIAIIRNPYDWLVSYAGHAGSWNPKYTNKEHYDYEAANISFDYLLKQIVNRDDIWPSRNTLFVQLFTTSGRFILDEILEQSKLNDEIIRIARKYNREYEIKSPLRVGNRRHYREYYTTELVELVKKTWGDELRFLGYSFDQKREHAPIDKMLGSRKRIFDPISQKIIL